ncbi:SMI1/KNR4 family protein [Pseudoduganella sp. S-14]|uniref:SMI1/KNR4 family protein n=1 Tax=Pseudoduganella sp. S-14 TaxID=3404065 RepID=UPI003CE9EE16
MTIQYKPNTLAPHFSQAEMDSMERMLSLDLPGFAFDPAYIEHVENFNGGSPLNKYFQTGNGRKLPIDRFLNYSDTKLMTDRSLQGLNANVVWSMIEDRLSLYLLPFAILPDGDFLCFDYEVEGRPSIVLWSHELSEEDEPHTTEVASNFDEFVKGLTDSF